MLPLRHPGRWRVVGFFLLIGVLAIAMVPAFLPWSDRAGPSWLLPSDKWLHGITFTFLSIWYSGQVERRSYWMIAVGLAMFGALIEFCQSLVTYRSAEAADLTADMFGIVTGLTIALIGVGGWSLRFEVWIQEKFG